MKWSPQQETALAEVAKWLHDRPDDAPFFYLAGFAGTGKTTITRHLLESFNGRIAYGAYTGKAALVMRKNGMPANTIHSQMYKYVPPSRENYEQLKKKLEEAAAGERPALRTELCEAQQGTYKLDREGAFASADLIVLDECSMVNEEMGSEILSFGKPVLVLGDPGQLPPIAGTGFFTARKPHMMLTEIHRQASDNPIIRLATNVRQGRNLVKGQYGESRVLSKHSVTNEEIDSADQLICGMNSTRMRIIRNYRTRHFGDSIHIPQKGERVICLKNERAMGILNGLMFEVISAEVDSKIETRVNMELSPEIDLRKEEEQTNPISVRARREFFDEYFTSGQVKALTYWDLRDYQQFDYAYCITGHKAQGSQWDNVLLVNDGFAKWDASLRRRWLYTCITRAAERITIGV